MYLRILPEVSLTAAETAAKIAKTGKQAQPGVNVFAEGFRTCSGGVPERMTPTAAKEP